MELHPILASILVYFSSGLIVTISLNIEVGLLRLPQFGRLLAVLGGAIVAASVPGRIVALYLGLPAGVDYMYDYNQRISIPAINSWLAQNPLASIGLLLFTLVLSALVGALIGYLCAYPALRLKGAYLGITLLSFGEILNRIADNYTPLIGGTVGTRVIDMLGFLKAGRTPAVLLMLGISILVYVYAELITRSPFGRMLKAIRDSEIAAEVYGKDVVKARGHTLMIGGALAAVAGALYAIFTGYVSARDYTRLRWTFWPWAFLMLGGVGNNLGVLLGVLLYSLAYTMIILFKHDIARVVPLAAEWLEYILIGAIIIVVVLIRPQGLLPEKPTPTLSREKLEKIRRKALQA